MKKLKLKIIFIVIITNLLHAKNIQCEDGKIYNFENPQGKIGKVSMNGKTIVMIHNKNEPQNLLHVLRYDSKEDIYDIVTVENKNGQSKLLFGYPCELIKSTY